MAAGPAAVNGTERIAARLNNRREGSKRIQCRGSFIARRKKETATVDPATAAAAIVTGSRFHSRVMMPPAARIAKPGPAKRNAREMFHGSAQFSPADPARWPTAAPTHRNQRQAAP